MAYASGNTSAAGLASAYMSPYLDSVAAATMGILGQQQGQQQNQLSGDIARNGQWGNSRSGVERALLSGQQNLATANTISNLYNTGYNTALGAAQTDLSRQLQAAQGLGTQGQSGANNLLSAGSVGQQSVPLWPTVIFAAGRDLPCRSSSCGRAAYPSASPADGIGRGMLACLGAAPGAQLPAVVSAAEVPDPIFAVIAERNRLEAIHVAAIHATDAASPGDEGVDYEAQDEACSAVCDYESDVLLRTAPTTPAGAIALLRLLAEIGDGCMVEGSGYARAILAAVEAIERGGDNV